MPRPSIAELQDDKEAKAYRAAVAILRESPDLAVVETWGVLLEDDNEAAACFLPPTLEMMPMVRVLPSARDDRGTTTAQSTSTIAIRVEIFTAGINAAHLLNLWSAVRRAWVGRREFRNTTVKCFLDREVDQVYFDVTSPGYGYGRAGRDADAPYYLSGVGQIEISFMRPR
jgi:hypothetical protein